MLFKLIAGFGTSVQFIPPTDIDMEEVLCFDDRFQSITSMKEYGNKIFEVRKSMYSRFAFFKLMYHLFL